MKKIFLTFSLLNIFNLVVFAKYDSTQINKKFFFFSFHIDPVLRFINENYPHENIDTKGLLIGNYYSGTSASNNATRPMIGLRLAKGFSFGINFSNKSYLSFDYYRRITQPTYGSSILFYDALFQSIKEDYFNINYVKNCTPKWFKDEGTAFLFGAQLSYKYVDYEMYNISIIQSGYNGYAFNNFANQLKLNFSAGLRYYCSTDFFIEGGVNINFLMASNNNYTLTHYTSNPQDLNELINNEEKHSQINIFSPVEMYLNKQIFGTCFIKMGFEFGHLRNSSGLSPAMFIY